MNEDFSPASLRIALLAHAPEERLSGGIKTVIQHLKAALPQLEIFPRAGWLQSHLLARLHLKPWFLNWWKNGFVFTKHFLKIHKEKPFDLLLVYPFAAAHIRPKQAGIPVINIYFGCFPEFLKQITKSRRTFLFQKWMTGFLDKKSGVGKHCITISEPVKIQIKKRYGHDCRVIPVGVDVTSFQPRDKSEARRELQWDADQPTGLFIGRAEFAKGWDIVTKVAQELPQVTFICITGNSPPPEAKNIVVKKNVSTEEMVCWHNAADFFIFPSRYESAALVVLESMACNLPVVISRPVADVCMEEGIPLGPSDGVYVAQDNRVEKYREAIQVILKKRERGKTRDYVEQHRSYLSFKKNMTDLIRAVLR